MCKEYWRFFASQQMPSEQTFLQIYYRCSSIAFTNSSAACCVQFLLRQCRTVGQMIPRVFHSEMDPSNHTKITNSEARSQSLMMRMACRRNETATNRLPNNSLTKAFMQLRYLKANKPTDRNAWKTKEIPKKIRDLFTLLGLPLPPRVFRD